MLFGFRCPQDCRQRVAEVNSADFLPLCRSYLGLVPCSVVADTAAYRKELLVKVDVLPSQGANFTDTQACIIGYLKSTRSMKPQQVLEDFTEEFHRRYGVECVSALHHNKRKTNYHIHFIFSERKLLPEPEIKIATRSVFYDEAGKRVRTKKEITDEDGKIRKGCTVIKKGEVYESHLFTTKDGRFKSEPFLREVKAVYTDLINRHISDPERI